MATTAVTQIFSLAAWSNSASSLPVSGGNAAYASSGAYKGTLMHVSGDNNAGSSVQTTYQFNTQTWATVANSSVTARSSQQAGEFNGFFYVAGALAGGGPEKFNNSAWSAFTDPIGNTTNGGAGQLSQYGFLYWVRGNIAAAPSDTAFQMNAAESTSALATASGVVYDNFGLACVISKLYKIAGFNVTPNAQQDLKSWNNSAWATESSLPIVRAAANASPSTAGFYYSGGQLNSGGVAQSVVHFYNFTSWSTAASLGTAVIKPSGGGLI